MIKSMTGYGRGSFESDGRSFTVEIKSVNNRYLDINIRLPKQMNALEDNIRKFVSSRISRGKIDIFITQDKFKDDDIKINVDEQVARAYYNSFIFLKEKFNLIDDISVSLFSRFPDIITVEKKDEDLSEVWNTLRVALDAALSMLIDMRAKEGVKLSKDIIERINYIKSLVKKIEDRSIDVVEEYRMKIKQRIEEYLKDIDIDESRLLNEVAFFSDKVNITEETVRLYSHLDQFASSLNSLEPIGRKLDFLIQEMNRETNTIGSKTNDLYITNIVVDIKSELEKIREQIQNIE
ncbi:YicC family protein [Caloramator sp. E03]|uniref:YicC/YloC family endoribonuclease n=1 Tax=Caloramator sp. E03 TaxID=2576307 RepID=UPI001110FABC|nr:YicC/YloC family endoribonuclease [Caloramator sp. E03]QCX32210.1 YicC family protein [Caloramator sp. E03]